MIIRILLTKELVFSWNVPVTKFKIHDFFHFWSSKWSRSSNFGCIISALKCINWLKNGSYFDHQIYIRLLGIIFEVSAAYLCSFLYLRFLVSIGVTLWIHDRNGKINAFSIFENGQKNLISGIWKAQVCQIQQISLVFRKHTSI